MNHLKFGRAKFTCLFFLFVVMAPVRADEFGVSFFYCYGNMQNLYIEGRVTEIRESSVATENDGWMINIWRKLRQLINDEREGENVTLSIYQQVFQTKTGEEGFFHLVLPTPESIVTGSYTATATIRQGKNAQCELTIVPPENNVGIISDFDDTVIVTEVLDKQQAALNTLTLNYKQRHAVDGMAIWYKDIIESNPKPDQAALFFVTGSPKQLQLGINQFLDYHQFPKRTIITKKINGDETDPLFDQVQYKQQKIEHLLGLYPNTTFILFGDDGEKDPEVYHDIYTRYPNQIKDIWIRKVADESTRARYPAQHLFSIAPAAVH